MRLQLFEFVDQPWLPSWLRQPFLEYLNFILYRMFQPYRGVERILERWAREARAEVVLDLGSGGSGQIEWLLRQAELSGTALPRFVLSDLFPQANIAAYAALQARYGSAKVGYCQRPVDACAPNEDGIRLRSMFSIFHHLKPHQARRLLADACTHADGILIADGVRRGLLPALLPILLFPSHMLLMPWVVPHFTWRRFFFSTVIPIIPFILSVDGCVSALRAYTAQEIAALFPGWARHEFEIELHTLPSMGGIFTTTVVTARRRVVKEAQRQVPAPRQEVVAA